jgi:predicted alpha/beta superfamily hydrolase
MGYIPLSDNSGVIQRYTAFPSRYFEPRNVDIWSPPGYDQDLTARYPVIYMHDGQNLFDSAIAFTGNDWGIDEAITRLIQQGYTRGAIVVGVWNGPRRWPDYMPQKLLEAPEGQELRARFIQEQGISSRSDDYLRFLVEELKPCIDEQYRTLPDQSHTFVMGSSMGGLASLYALEEYPQVFSRAGCLSTHWPAGGDLLVDYLGARLPPPGTCRLYFDYGTATLDALYEPYQLRFDAILLQHGYQPGQDWITLKFENAEHNESAWRARVEIPLRFLLN